MTYEEAVESIPQGMYKHFKGKMYEVVGIALHTETSEPLVIYRWDEVLYARPASMWYEPVKVDGTTCPRFGRVDLQEDDHLDEN